MVASRLYGPVQQDLALVEEVINSLRQVDYQPLAQMLELVLSTSGKRLRPALVLLAGTFGHYRLDLLVPLAASVELLHTATLVHDDVIDSADTRRGRPTVNSVFHNSTCVMLGDYMFAHAAELVARTGNIRVIRLFAHTLMVMARGEITQDMSAYDSRQDVQEYLHRIAGKTASLFATACEGGAIVAGEPEEWVQALREYGYNLGMAFQIVDDILDFTGNEAEMGKPVGSDLMQGTLTLPSLLLMQRYPTDNPVQRFFRERTEDHLQQAVLMVRESDIPAESYAMASQFSRRAREALSPLPATEARRTLEELAQYILERRS
ncbi:MAG TPA: polyprenyl synthetase family protein [Dehalococcoidia bacterium]|nr:polyprenyl synthetase family protein [Dehalococcoidia bacterium]